MIDDGVLAPASTDEMFRQYYGYVRRIVANTPAIPAQDAEDVAMEIMTRLVERDVLGMFDPQMKFAHEGQQMQAKFRTFLTAQVALYVKGQRDRLGRQRKHEAVVLDAPVPGAEGTHLLDLFGGAEDDMADLDAAEWIRQARGFLATVPPRSAQDRCDLVRLFDALIDQMSRTGRVSTSETAQSLGVTSAVTSRWLQWMRQNLRQQAVLSARVTIDGETYTMAHCRQAAALLRARKGAPHVRQPLAAAGNPLALMNYHKIARYERATYPECEVPPMHKGKGHYAPHVLNAVVHHLERVAPAPA
jgi:DNA-directed RNA polymerase specialized sigma24 family protein